MTLAQKSQVWLAALKALHSATYGQKGLVASDVAKALGLACIFDANEFVLIRFHNSSNPCSRFTRVANFKA